MSIDQITTVITSYKSDEKIIKCLKSINNECKIIVIENSTNISFKENIEKNFFNTEVVIAGQNLGYAKGNNLGLSKVKTKYALILNPDSELENNTLDKFLQAADKIRDFAIIGPAIQDEKNLQNNSKLLKEVDSVKGFAMFLNLEQFNDVGFFDDNFFIYLEEIDLCKRLKQKKKKIFVVPDILIHHQGGVSHDEKYNFEMELSRNWHWMWSTFYYHKKYNSFILALIKVMPKLFSSFIKIIFYLLIFKKDKRAIYWQRFSGLFNSIIGRKSWYRPKVN